MIFVLVCFALVSYVATTPTVGTLQDLKVVGGEDIDISEAPYQVSLVKGGRHSCGGAIIANDIILTAAHCIKGSNAFQYQVRVGSSFDKEGGELYPVGDLVWHPGFDFVEMDNDIAVMWLSRPLKFNSRVKPVEMMKPTEEVADGELTEVTGWGNILESGGYPSMLQKALVPKVNEESCNAAYNPVYSITPRMLCAGSSEGGLDACQGDSGGPLVYKNKLAGIVSWGLGCARPEYPGVYAKVSALRPWIEANIRKLRRKHSIFRSE